MVGGKAATQRLCQWFHFRDKAAPRQLCQMFRIGFSGDQRVQHGTARDAQHIGDYVRQLDVGRFQQLMHTVSGLDPIPDEALTMAREIARVPDCWRRDETSTNQAMRQQIRDPLAVLHVGLPARHRLDVVRIGQDDLEAPFEEIENWVSSTRSWTPSPRACIPPATATRAASATPRSSCRTVVPRPSPVGLGAISSTRPRFFVNIDPATARMNHFHGTPPTARRAGECHSVRVYLACSSSLVGGRATVWGA